jgi:hypothetical protein
MLSTLFAAIEAPVPVQRRRRLLGAALGDVTGSGLARPGPVVPLVLGEGAVWDRLVAAPAELLDDSLGDAHPLVGGDSDLHAGD